MLSRKYLSMTTDCGAGRLSFITFRRIVGEPKGDMKLLIRLFVVIHERTTDYTLKKACLFRAQARFLKALQFLLHSDQN